MSWEIYNIIMKDHCCKVTYWGSSTYQKFPFNDKLVLKTKTFVKQLLQTIKVYKFQLVP